MGSIGSDKSSSFWEKDTRWRRGRRETVILRVVAAVDWGGLVMGTEKVVAVVVTDGLVMVAAGRAKDGREGEGETEVAEAAGEEKDKGMEEDGIKDALHGNMQSLEEGARQCVGL